MEMRAIVIKGFMNFMDIIVGILRVKFYTFYVLGWTGSKNYLTIL